MKQLPIIPLKDIVVFPHIFIPLSIGREFSKKAIVQSIENENAMILAVLQKNIEKDNIDGIEDVHQTAVLCKILKFEPVNKTTSFKLLVQGVERVSLKSLSMNKEHLVAEYESLTNPVYDLTIPRNKATYDLLLKDLIHIIDKGFSSEALIPIKELENPIASCYLFLSITQGYLENQKVLEMTDALEVVNQTYSKILEQKEYLTLKNNILEQAKENMSKSQKEYFLKEQMKAIRKELGEDGESDIDSYILKLAKIKHIINTQTHDEILKCIKKLKNAVSETHEISVLRNYLDYVFELPWEKKTEDNLDINFAKQILDNEHYDLVKVKERILEFLSIKKLNPDSKGSIICFVGPPGVGKSTFAQSIAHALGRESSKIALGGVKDEAELRGHRRTYVGAMPGKIMQGMRQVGVINPVFILDEIDKLGNDFRGDPASALLEILDPEQNNAFKDHYINIDYDLSKVMFIATANNVASIPAPLRDRMEIIEISGYCEEEKIEIAKKFIIPKKVSESGLLPAEISFSKDIIRTIIRNYTKEFGVRDLARQVFKICRKVAKLKALGELKEPIKMDDAYLFKFLGPEKFNSTEDNKNGIGVVTGLAWTPYGGELLKIEAISIEDETGDPILTGQLGSVMQESAKTALSLIKSNAAKWGITDKKVLKNKIHIHAPAGATPKDGPSAGIALVSCLVSLYLNKKIKNSIAMTGEITLTGKVLPIGGVREKILAAIRSNIKLVILPKDNEKDYLDFVELIGEKIKVIYVSHISEVLKEIF